MGVSFAFIGAVMIILGLFSAAGGPQKTSTIRLLLPRLRSGSV